MSRWLGDVLYTKMVQPPLVSVKRVELRPLVSILLRLLGLRRVMFVP